MLTIPATAPSTVAQSAMHSYEKRSNALLWCGVASSLLYVLINIIVPLGWEGYSHASQVVSELSAIGAPTRRLWIVVSAPYMPLVTLFGWGVWRSAGNSRRLRIAGVLLVLYGALGLVWPFFPMHMRDVLAAGGGNFSDQMHIALAAVTVFLMFLAMAMGAAALGASFRVYTVVSVVILLACGALTAMESPKLDDGLPTPLLGLWERINIGVFLLWVIMLALTIMREQSRNARHGRSRANLGSSGNSGKVGSGDGHVPKSNQ